MILRKAAWHHVDLVVEETDIEAASPTLFICGTEYQSMIQRQAESQGPNQVV